MMSGALVSLGVLQKAKESSRLFTGLNVVVFLGGSCDLLHSDVDEERPYDSECA